MEQDIRWEQRLSNFNKALHKLTQAVEYIKDDSDHDEPLEYSDMDGVLDEIIKEGLIQRFEYTHELAWNVMRDYAKFQGITNVGGSRDATREAFQLQLISDGNVWMEMIGSRNQTSHTYNEKTANDIYSRILNDYYPAFLEFQKNMEAKRSEEQGKLF
jgi:nucleotidyltransferase substrate binding protein (TIGR01987 family)